MIEVRLSESNILKRTVLKLRDDTVAKLKTLDKNKYSADFTDDDCRSIELYKKERRKKRIGTGTKIVFIKIAIFHSNTSDIEAHTEEDFEECKALGEELGYETITQHWGMKTEKEIYDTELTESQKEFAEKYRYSNCLFRFKVRDVMDGHAQKKLSDAEVVGWIKKLLEEI